MRTGAKLKQKKSLVAEPAVPLEIHVDEELAQQPSPRRRKAAAASAAAPSLRLRLDACDLEEHLQHDPLRLLKVCHIDMLGTAPISRCNTLQEWITCHSAA